jgi:crossover junction endodeoxyribonuclease RuvC
MASAVRFMAVDPGSIRAGFALFELKGQSLRLISSGVLCFDPKQRIADRLGALALDVRTLISKHQPTEMALETVFVAKNARSALHLGYARGVILAEAAGAQLEIIEYSPRLVKKAVGGTGAASKDQIEKMIRLLLGLSPSFGITSHDQSDAIALGIAHAQHRGMEHLSLTMQGRKKKKNDRASFWQDNL